MPGHWLIRWTIWLSMLAYVAFLCGSLRPKWCSWSTRRTIWTFACVMFIGHFIAAFHYYHRWSHAHAVADTAEKTRALMGWAFGEGIYFSYLFLVIWILDVVWMWAAALSYQKRAAGIGVLVHGYLMFIAVNGTAVFESGVTRWATVASGIGLLALLATLKRQPSGTS